MFMVYDTRPVHPLDRYDHYREGAAAELAPVTVHGRSPGNLLATMSVAQVGDFAIETLTWVADSEVMTRRTNGLIRAGDPECYRIYLSVDGGAREEQAGNQLLFGPRDIALFDVSRPFQSVHPTGSAGMRVVMLMFPHSLVPIGRDAVRPLVGTLMPKRLKGHSLFAQLLIDLTDATTINPADDPHLVHLLRECAVGLICQRVDRRNGISPHTRRYLYRAHIRDVIRRHLHDPALNPDRIARVANISPRHLHRLFEDAELTPMQLLQRLRLEECHRSLQDPALAMTPIKDLVARHGYPRHDQFARDFKQLFGVSATHVRRAANRPPAEPER